MSTNSSIYWVNSMKYKYNNIIKLYQLIPVYISTLCNQSSLSPLKKYNSLLDGLPLSNLPHISVKEIIIFTCIYCSKILWRSLGGITL